MKRGMARLSALLAAALTMQLLLPAGQAARAVAAEAAADASWTISEKVDLSTDGSKVYPSASAVDITPDGRYMVFEATGTDMDARLNDGGMYRLSHIYWHDRLTGRTELIDAVGSEPEGVANESSERPSISDDGQRIAFQSIATNLIEEEGISGLDPLSPDNFRRVYVYDRGSKSMTLVSVNSVGEPADYFSQNAAISGDGETIVFESEAGNLAGEQDQYKYNWQIYAHELSSRTTVMISDPEDGQASQPAISADGSYAVYVSERYDYERDQLGADVYRIGADGTGKVKLTDTAYSDSWGAYGNPSISADGTRIVLESSTDVIPSDMNERKDIYLIQLGEDGLDQLDLVSLGDSGQSGNDDSYTPDISPDGRYISFVSKATNLRAGMAFESQYNVQVPYIYDIQQHQLTNLGGLEHAAYGLSPKLGGGGFAYVDSMYPYVAIRGGDELPVWPNDKELIIQEGQHSGIVLSWAENTSPGVLGYKVYEKMPHPELGDYYAVEKLLGYVTGTTYEVAAPPDDPSGVYYRVEAVNSLYHTSQDGPESSLEPKEDVEEPYWEENAVIEKRQITSSSVTLTWPAARDDVAVTGYKLYRAAPGAPETRTLVKETTVPTATDTELQPDTEYLYEVVALDAAQRESLPLSIVLRTLAATDPEGGLLTAEALPNGDVRLSWTEGDAAARYEIWGGATSEPSALAAETNEGETEFVVAGLEPSRDYTYRVQGYDGADELVYETQPAEVRTAALEIGGVTVSRASVYGGVAAIGSSETITVTGQPGRTVVVKAVYSTWLDENGQEIQTPRQAELLVPMTESGTTPGQYTGTFTFAEGVEKLIQVEAKLTAQSGHESSRVSAQGLPIMNAAKLLLHLQSEGSLLNYKASVYSAASLSSQSQRIDSDVTAATLVYDRLKSGAGGGIRLFSHTGKLLDQVAAQALKSGLTVEQTIEVVPYKKLELTVRDDNGPVADRLISLTGDNGNYLTLKTGPDGRLPVMDWDWEVQEVTVEALQLPFKYESHEAVRIVLDQAVNQKLLELPLRAVATITGTVRNENSQGLSGVDVVLKQTVDGELLSRAAVTDSQGHYSIPAYLGETELFFQANQYETGKKTITVNGPSVVDHQFTPNVRHKLKINLYTKYEGGQWQGPLPIDWTTAIHLRVNVDGRGVTSDLVDLIAPTGSSITVTANGVEGGLGRASATAVLEADGYTEIELRLEQNAYKVSGKLKPPAKWEDHQIGYWWGELLKQNQSGAWEHARYISKNHSSFTFLMEEAGTFKLVVEANAGKAERVFQAQGMGDIQLGDLQLREEASVFEGKAGNLLTAYPTELSAGQTTKIRLSYEATAQADNARFLLGVPEGTELVAGSVSLDGEPAAYETEGSGLIVEAGHLNSGQKGTITYVLKVLDSAAARLSVSGKVVHGADKSELIGVVTLVHEPVTLEAPDAVDTLEWSLSGKAPAGAEVSVYASGALLGHAKASQGGFWKLQVHVPNPQGEKVYIVHAEMEQNGTKLRSPAARVHYDPDRPVIEGLTIEQTDGRRISLDVSQGPVRFPYVVVPSSMFGFEVAFNHPDKVRNVQVHIRDGERLLSATGELREGIYYASMQSGWNMTESVYVTFDRVDEGLQDINSLEALQSELPPAMRDYEIVSQEEFAETSPGTLAGSIELRLPQANDLTYEIEMELQRNSGYTPTAAEIAEAEKLGIQAYGTTYELIQDGSEYRMIVTSYVPESQITNMAGVFASIVGQPSLQRKGLVRVANANAIGSLVKATTNILWNEKSVVGQIGKGGVQIFDTKNAVDGRGQVADKMSQLGNLADRIAECNPSMAGYYGGQIEELATHAISIEGAKWGMMIAGAVLAPATFGGSLALLGLTMGIGAALDANVDQRMNRLKDRVNKSAEANCDPDGEGDVSEINLGNPTALPVWIYDPSGYVYETFPDNRIEGATATVYYWDTELSRYVPWDAEWYGQHNPQTTDALGKYGWDVPPGKWQVVYEKNGYETARSAELPVPPPHFDVNIPMVSYEAPVVAQVRAVSDNEGAETTIIFSKYVSVQALAEEGVSISLDGTALSGTLRAVDAQLDEEGVLLAREFRFTSGNAVTPGEQLTVRVREDYVLSYAGVMMEADYAGDVTVESADSASPVLLSAEAEAGGSTIKLQFDESLNRNSRLSHSDFTLTGTPRGVELVQYGTDGRSVILSLNGKLPSYSLPAMQVQIAANRVVDGSGNFFSGGSVSVAEREGASDAYLSSLQVQGYALSSSFQPNRSEYQLTVPEGVDELRITASARASLATIRVNGSAVQQGSASTVPIVEETVLIVVTSEDGLAKRYYELAVVRGNSGAGPGPGPGPVVPGHSADGEGKQSRDGKLELGAGEGGTVSDAMGRAEVIVPQGAMNVPFTVWIEQLSDWANHAGAAEGMTLASAVYEINKTVEGRFAKAVTITLRLTQAPKAGQSAAIYYYDEEKGVWISIGGKVNGDAITATVDHFTKFAAFIQDEEAELEEIVLTDIQGHWAYDYIREAISLGFVKGYPNGSFKPNANVTRAQFAAMLAQALGLQAGTGASTGADADAGAGILAFRDAASIPDWAKASIAAVLKAGLITGYENGEFRPNQPISRAEIVVILMRTLELPDTGALQTGFVDNGDIPEWARTAAAVAFREGLVQGRSGNRFVPNGLATRAEAAKLVVLLLERLEQSNE
ncbi:S-layer homology domain-containing protein [Paenibacillus sp. PL2-23]|uniref:S-layer homology domain-containing protein n=1 Tax=Paenibacillus sp. PL2-23 TaxID=2100729 RepID=UPI0030F79B9F